MSGIIEFVPEDKTIQSPVFSDVETDQFFIDKYSQLCQKKDDDTYHIIADADGNPDSRTCDAYGETNINKILPRIEKINF